MRVLITGITGFAGAYLAEDLLAATGGVEVFGLVRRRSARSNLEPLLPLLRLVEGDLQDATSLLRALQAARPAVIYHLAAASSVAGSWATPAEILQTNAVGTLHLLEAVRQLDLDATVVLACSAEPYGVVAEDELPIVEDHDLRPVSPYGVSKAAVDFLGYQYFHTHGLHTVRLRLFNHCGPRQPERFVVASLARQIVEIERKLRPPQLRAGNLEARRDFIDVRDAVRAYRLAAERGRAGEVYNVCSGHGRSIREVLDDLLSVRGAAVEVACDPTRLRPAEIPALVGDPSRFENAVGWRPAIAFRQTLLDTLEYWQRRLGA